MAATSASDFWAAADALAGEWTLARCPGEVSTWMRQSPAEATWLGLCSGGADSVALTLWLAAQARARGGVLHVLHVHHGLRGAAAEGDADSVRALCEGLGLPFHLHRLEGTSETAREEALRRERWAAAAALAAAVSAAAVFTGHHADDVVENLLLRLARGSGLRGLSGLRPMQVMQGEPPRLRPLLNFSRAEIVAALTQSGLSWREDASNTSERFARNRLRLAVVPAWREATPERALTAAVRQSHEALIEADAAIEAIASEVELTAALPVALLRPWPRAVRRRILERWARSHGPVPATPSATTLERWLSAIEEDSPGGWSVAGQTVRFDGVCFSIDPAFERLRPVALDGPGRYALAGGAILEVAWVALDGATRAAIFAGHHAPTSQVWLAGVAFPLSARARRAGDRYQPLGAPGVKKLQDAMVDARIPRGRRDTLPVLCDATGAILWVPGLAPAERCRIGRDSIGALRLTYTSS